MTDAILIFTFGPIQSFIAEARRAADLYTGSQILVELAKAAGGAIEKRAANRKLIYPAALTDDVPNKLVAKVPWDDCETIAFEARDTLLERWRELVDEAQKEFLSKTSLPFDLDIWNRQTGDDYLWETFWSAASIDGRDYKAAYSEAEQGLVALKFTRPFQQYTEPGFKDTLSGRREALHPKDQNGREYWLKVGNIKAITPITIRPSTETRPRERLDAAGVIKRFHPVLSEKPIAPFRGFPSTSSMASWTFLNCARDFAKDALAEYRQSVKNLLPEPKYEVRPTEADWPFDGDLLYPETLRPRRMESDYGKDFSEADIKDARGKLQDLYAALRKERNALEKRNDLRYTKIHTHPSPYYAVIVVDGDSMGQYLRLLDEQEHHAFSESLLKFSAAVADLADKHQARVIYNGGDDVLAFAPLDTALPLARALADAFQEKTGRTASAGIAISHHLSPLGTALRAAHHAEQVAKNLSEKKNAVCVIALKRSGEPIEVCSAWGEVAPFEQVVAHFANGDIASRLPYDLARSAYALPAVDEKFEAELRRLLKRHWQKGKPEEKETAVRALSTSLNGWAKSFLSGASPSPASQLADWLALARFVAKGGRE